VIPHGHSRRTERPHECGSQPPRPVPIRSPSEAIRATPFLATADQEDRVVLFPAAATSDSSAVPSRELPRERASVTAEPGRHPCMRSYVVLDEVRDAACRDTGPSSQVRREREAHARAERAEVAQPLAWTRPVIDLPALELQGLPLQERPVHRVQAAIRSRAWHRFDNRAIVCEAECVADRVRRDPRFRRGVMWSEAQPPEDFDSPAWLFGW